jgi:hypothetical protein
MHENIELGIGNKHTHVRQNVVISRPGSALGGGEGVDAEDEVTWVE